jgi:hypothetical protein
MATNGTTDTQIISGVNGSGTYLPMSFYVNNTLALQISTAGVVSAPYGGFSGTGGMTLLGTLTTTSGTTQTLSGLTLTNYKYLQISVQNVGSSSTSILRLDALDLYSSLSTGTNLWGTIFVDLSNSTFSSMLADIPASSGSVAGSGSTRSGKNSYTTASTSISFTQSAGNFNSGTIKIYGVA